MTEYYKLENVRDVRTDKIHSVAIVSEKTRRYFVPVE